MRFYDEIVNKVVSCLWQLIPIYNDDDDDVDQANSENLHNGIINSFENTNIPFDTNFVCFCSDGTSTMQGVRNSVGQRFQRNYPGCIKDSCSCHAVHLSHKKPCEKLIPPLLNARYL